MKTLILLFSALFATMSFAQVPSYVPANGLVGWWPFNGNANDESGNGNNGTVNGATLTTNRINNPNSAYQFNRSSSQSIDISNNTGLNNITELTISIWYNIQSNCCGNNHFINKSDQSNLHQFIFADNNIGLYFYHNTNFFQTNTLTPLNQWNNVILTYEYNGSSSSICRFYLNGLLTDAFPTSSQLIASNFNLRFGSFGSQLYDVVDGTIDDIGIWNRALTDCEIQNLYSSSISAQPTGLSCWQSAIFNTITCAWDVTGTQPTQPTSLACYQTATFNTITCAWDVTGTQAPEPTGLACYQTATFNTITCAWDVTGTQVPEPTGLSCWQTATFNSLTCSWVTSGSQPVQPTLACYETATFNTATCAWVISGPQAPQKMSYQAIIRNSNDSLFISTPVGMRISLVQGAPSGTVVFSETQTATTNANGLVSLQIGMGTAVSGTFACIDWAAGPYYVKTETDLAGGTNYTIISSNELLSVPYALFSANGPTGAQGPAGPQGPQGTLPPGTAVGEMNYWNGTAWVAVAPGTNNQNLTFCNGVPTWGPCPPLVIGQSYQGGIVAYILQPGDPGYDANIQHGLIAAPSDQGTAPWGCGFGGADSGTLIFGANGTAIGSGSQNTIDIMNGCSEAGIAARLCGDLVLNGYSDWYLPSKDELNQLLTNQTAIGDVTHHFYWSSSEYSTALAWWSSFDFNIGPQWKSFIGYVRAVRSF